MYLKIGSLDIEDKGFSFILAKNPHGDPFLRDLGGSDGERFVEGRYVENERTYEVIVRNDEAFILQGLRDKNLPSYVTAKAYAVTPFNLKGMAVALKSAMSGRNSSGGVIEDAEVARLRPMFAVIGPFALPFAAVQECFVAAGIEVEDVSPSVSSSTCTVRLTATASVALFLQKIYTLATYLTIHQGDSKYLEDDKIRALIKTASPWLATMGEYWVQKVVRSLSGGHKGFQNEFKESLVPVEDAEETDEEVPQLQPAKGLHERRHALIIEQLLAMGEQVGMPPPRIVELGCANGKLLAKLREAFPDKEATEIVGIEADLWDLTRARRRSKGATRVVHDNIVSPYLELASLKPAVLILSEVIEHLDKPDRLLLLRQLKHMWQPRAVIITCPNSEYNIKCGFSPGEMRHPDHRIEHTREQFNSEVVQSLSEAYECVLLDLLPGEDLQPSHVLVGIRREADREPDLGLLYRAREMHTPYAIEETGYTVNSEEMRAGLTHRAYLSHRRQIPFLSPTMAPVDYDPAYGDYLEHPAAVFRYYEKRGVGMLAEQNKLMGSRAHIIVFRDPEDALAMGFETPAYAVSRGGHAFFDNYVDLMRIHDAIAPRMETGMLLLDCEVMPWSYKAGSAKGLIEKQFKAPGQAALQYLTLTGQDTTNADLFLKALKNYAQEGELSIHPFAVIAQANVNQRGHYENVTLGENLSVYDQTSWLFERFGGLKPFIRPLSTRMVMLGSAESEKESIDRWKMYTEMMGGEGFVYKPAVTFNMPDGAPIQPAIKVRGRDYLRIIYGLNYLQPHIFGRLTHRGTSAKRRLAIQETALGRRVLMSFLRDMHPEHERCVAAFLGMDGVTSAKIDATL